MIDVNILSIFGNTRTRDTSPSIKASILSNFKAILRHYAEQLGEMITDEKISHYSAKLTALGMTQLELRDYLEKTISEHNQWPSLISLEIMFNNGTEINSTTFH